MLQTIIVYIIIIFAISYTIYSVVKSIRKKETSACGDCNGCGIKDEITKNITNKKTKDPTTCGCGPNQ
ncbi:MAG: FeoB-associated Cys-rich membrane protein [Paludibacter sp.]